VSLLRPFHSFPWLLLIPIDLPLRLPGDLLGLCVCCFAIAGFKGAIKLSAGLVDINYLIISQILADLDIKIQKFACQLC
jgi:hypothetical protein